MKINSESWTEIVNNIHQGRLFYWGAGKRLSVFLHYAEEDNLNLIPSSIIDNDIIKRYTYRRIGDMEVPVILWDDVQMQKDETITVIITLLHYQDVINQLELYDNGNIHILTYEYVLGIHQKYGIRNKKLLFSIKRTDKPMIPKIIHYFWFGGKTLPEKNRKYIEGWKEKCPDYEIREWNEYNYDVTKNIFMKQAWESKRWAFAADYARLDIVYEYGGIYLDTDVEVLKNLDDLLYQEAYLGFEGNLFINTGLGFGARKNHPLIKGMRDDYDGRCYSEDGTIHNCTYYQTAYLKKYGLITNGQHQHIGDMTVYPASVLCSCCFWGKIEARTPDSYTMHHYDASWAI